MRRRENFLFLFVLILLILALCIVLPVNQGLLFHKDFQLGLDLERRVLPALSSGFNQERPFPDVMPRPWLLLSLRLSGVLIVLVSPSR